MLWSLILGLLVAYVVLGIAWATFMAVIASGQGDPLTIQKFFKQVLTWPRQAWSLLGPD